MRFFYGQKPPVHTPYLAGDSKLEAVDKTLLAREKAIAMVKQQL